MVTPRGFLALLLRVGGDACFILDLLRLEPESVDGINRLAAAAVAAAAAAVVAAAAAAAAAVVVAACVWYLFLP